MENSPDKYLMCLTMSSDSICSTWKKIIEFNDLPFGLHNSLAQINGFGSMVRTRPKRIRQICFYVGIAIRGASHFK